MGIFLELDSTQRSMLPHILSRNRKPTTKRIAKELALQQVFEKISFMNLHSYWHLTPNIMDTKF
jgi:hypothetical protein